MIEIETQVEIDAEPSKVWSVLTDFDSMPSWNPFIRSIAGLARKGNRLKVKLEPPGQSEMTFSPIVLSATPNCELRWKGIVLHPWLFAGEHFFRLENVAGGGTRLIQGEQFTGVLAPLLMRGRMLEATREGFGAMNAALKQQCESTPERNIASGF